MDGAEYRVIITGELIDGFDFDEVVGKLAALFKQPQDTMARLFSQRPIPINTPYPAGKAEKVRLHLHSLGAQTRLEAIERSVFALEPMAEEAGTQVEPTGFSCPKCGQVQEPQESCSGCGVIFAKLQEQPGSDTEEAEAEERDESFDEALFVGNNSDRYLEQFRKFRRGKRNSYEFTWHWPALFVPFYWAMYRKMWGWSIIILLSAVLWPFTNFLWAMSANYLYFGHMNKKLAFLRKKGRAMRDEELEEKIMVSGGTSALAMVLGIALTLFVGYQFVKGMGGMVSEKMAQVQAETVNDHMPKSVIKTPLGTKTFLNMNVLSIGLMMTAHDPNSNIKPGSDIETVASELKLPPKAIHDGWGKMMSLEVRSDGFVLASAGPDGEFNTDDDLVMNRKKK